MKLRSVYFVLLSCITLSACSQPPSPKAIVPQSSPATPPIVGNDRDAHGCIGSAGYSWCQRTQRCERPWELAQSRGFENSAQAFAAFCK